MCERPSTDDIYTRSHPVESGAGGVVGFARKHTQHIGSEVSTRLGCGICHKADDIDGTLVWSPGTDGLPRWDGQPADGVEGIDTCGC